MSKSKAVRVIKLLVVAVIALAMPRAISPNKTAAVPRRAARAKVDVIPPHDGQPDDVAKH